MHRDPHRRPRRVSTRLAVLTLVTAAGFATGFAASAAPVAGALPGRGALPRPAPPRTDLSSGRSSDPRSGPRSGPKSGRTADPDPVLTVTKDNFPTGQVAPGQTIVYRFTVVNSTAPGTDTATHVVLTDTLDPGLSYVAGSNSACSAVGRTVTCEVGDLARGDSSSFLFEVTVGDDVLSGDVLENSGTVTAVAATSGHRLTFTSNTVSNTVVRSDFTLAKTVNASVAVPGDTLIYRVRLANDTAAAIEPLRLVERLPRGVVIQHVVVSQGSASHTAPVTWDVGRLGPGEAATLTVFVTVDRKAVGRRLVDEAHVTEGPQPYVPRRYRCGRSTTRACATTLVAPLRLAVTKTADRYTVAPGRTVRYTVVVRNLLNTPLTAASFDDDLSDVLDDATLRDVTSTVGTARLVGSRLEWVGNLPALGTARVTYTVRVHRPDTGNRRLVDTVTSRINGTTCPAGPPRSTGRPARGCTVTGWVHRRSGPHRPHHHGHAGTASPCDGPDERAGGIPPRAVR